MMYMYYIESNVTPTRFGPIHCQIRRIHHRDSVRRENRERIEQKRNKKNGMMMRRYKWSVKSKVKQLEVDLYRQRMNKWVTGHWKVGRGGKTKRRSLPKRIAMNGIQKEYNERNGGDGCKGQ